MFNLDKLISDSVIFRPSRKFEPDIKANSETLTREIKGKKGWCWFHWLQPHQGCVAV